MIHKLSKPPVTQRHFATVWGELDYLCKKIHFWLYSRKMTVRAERYLDRLERVLADLPDNDLAILRHEASALLHELNGQISDAIACRQREIELMERLQKEAHSPNYSAKTAAYMLRGRDTAALKDRRAILAALRKQAAQQLDSANGSSR